MPALADGRLPVIKTTNFRGMSTVVHKRDFADAPALSHWNDIKHNVGKIEYGNAVGTLGVPQCVEWFQRPPPITSRGRTSWRKSP